MEKVKSFAELNAELAQAEKTIKIISHDLESAYKEANDLRWKIYQHNDNVAGPNYIPPKPKE